MKNIFLGLLLLCSVLPAKVYGKPAPKDSVESATALKLNRIELTGNIALGFEKNDVLTGALLGLSYHGKYIELTDSNVLPFYFLSYKIGMKTTFRELIFDFSFGPEVIVNEYLFFRLNLGYWKILINETSRKFGFNFGGDAGLIVPLGKKIGVGFGAGIHFFTNEIENPLAILSVGLIF